MEMQTGIAYEDRPAMFLFFRACVQDDSGSILDGAPHALGGSGASAVGGGENPAEAPRLGLQACFHVSCEDERACREAAIPDALADNVSVHAAANVSYGVGEEA